MTRRKLVLLAGAVALSAGAVLAHAQGGSAPGAMPQAVEQRIAAMTITTRRANDLLDEFVADTKRIRQMADENERRSAGRQRNQAIRQLVAQAEERRLLRAVNSPDELQEKMQWFWFNHFNVFWQKAQIGVLLGDYEEKAIRPQVLGQFCGLLRSVTFHPAMLMYLDNARNVAGRINENHARELLELHTLGVDGGYTQSDVQELARVLTGLRLPPPGAGQLASFDARRHDTGRKRLLGQDLPAGGLTEVDAALQVLCRHPATARHLATKLAQFFHSDEPPAALVTEVAQVFMQSKGDIRKTVGSLLASAHFTNPAPSRFRDPYQYVVAAVRLTYGDRVLTNMTPVVRWISDLGQPVYGRRTPDGYPLRRREWASAGQLAARFVVAREIATAGAKLSGDAPIHVPDALVRVHAKLDPALGSATRQAIARATSPEQELALLLASPEFMGLP